jgi:signal transduction histidine kinase
VSTGALAGLDLRKRLEVAAAAVAYSALALALTLTSVVVVVVGSIVGLVLLPLWVGLPILISTAEAAGGSAQLARRLANRLLHARIPPLPRPRSASGFSAARLRGVVGGEGFSRAAALLLFNLPVSFVGAAVAALALALVAGALLLAFQGLTGVGGPAYVGPFERGPLTGLALVLLAAPAAIVSLAVLGGLSAALRRFIRSLLSVPTASAGPVREMLAESLGDRTLSIAYWLPEREVFVDERGVPVEMPEPGSRRAWTSVDRGGRRVAAIIHDADLDAGPELVQAAAAGASLALDNERLKADLRARLEELRASRARIVEAGDEARRRLERDLHDGAQQQLVALALELRLLERKASSDPETAAVIQRAGAQLGAALDDLRELAQGIHPAILTDRGLGPAAEAATRRFPLEVDLDVRVEGRYSPAVEAAGYFVVTEALTNVVKYAHPSRVAVRLTDEDDDVVVEVVDDGVGGADPDRGSGLRGLRDRLAAVDGELMVDSSPGRGTRVVARIPARPARLQADSSGGPAATAAPTTPERA